MTAFTLNGRAVEVTGDHPHLLAALREELDVVSPKDGCSPTGQCGCCTVLVDGKAQVSCQVPLTRVEGRAVTTVEGLAADERDRIAGAFVATGALQCGFCTPGIASAGWVSMRTTVARAWSASRSAAWSMPGSRRSST